MGAQMPKRDTGNMVAVASDSNPPAVVNEVKIMASPECWNAIFRASFFSILYLHVKYCIIHIVICVFMSPTVRVKVE